MLALLQLLLLQFTGELSDPYANSVHLHARQYAPSKAANGGA